MLIAVVTTYIVSVCLAGAFIIWLLVRDSVLDRMAYRRAQRFVARDLECLQTRAERQREIDRLEDLFAVPARERS